MRVGVVSYLNTLPLAHGLERYLPGAEIIRTSPAEIAAEMEQGNLDVGLVPVATLAQHPEWSVIPGLGIGSKGPVQSVVFLSQQPLESVQHWSQDPASRTSNTLTRLWLREHLGRDIPGTPGSADLGERLQATGAAVCIGDLALFPTHDAPVCIDLGEAWTTWTGLPFVYAVWAGPQASAPGLADALHVCYEENSTRLHDLAHWESPHDAARRARIESYLRWNIRYRVGESETRGLQLFLELGAEAGLTASGKVSHARP